MPTPAAMLVLGSSWAGNSSRVIRGGSPSTRSAALMLACSTASNRPGVPASIASASSMMIAAAEAAGLLTAFEVSKSPSWVSGAPVTAATARPAVRPSRVSVERTPTSRCNLGST